MIKFNVNFFFMKMVKLEFFFFLNDYVMKLMFDSLKFLLIDSLMSRYDGRLFAVRCSKFVKSTYHFETRASVLYVCC